MSSKKTLAVDDGSEKKRITVSKDLPGITIAEEPKTVDPAGEAPKENLTVIQKRNLVIEKYKVMAELYTNSTGPVIIAIRAEQDYKKGYWHFIPYDVLESERPNNGNKKYCIELYCIDDKNCMRRFKKLLRRYMPQATINFYEITSEN